jgi:transcription-repair coupling factor (superfamily II helicase)
MLTGKIKNRQVLPGAEGLLIRDLIATQQKATVLYLTHDSHDVLEKARAIQCFNPKAEVLAVPAWDVLPYDRVSPSYNIISRRIATLQQLTQAVNKPRIVIAPIAAALQQIAPPSFFEELSLLLKPGLKVGMERLIRIMIDSGYARAPVARDVGEFAVRGSILDIVMHNDEQGYRLDFFGDVLDTIRLFDPSTQVTKRRLEELNLTPIKELSLNEEAVQLFKSRYLAEFGSTDDPLYVAVTEGRSYPGMEHWLPFFHTSLATIFDFLPTSTQIVLDRFLEQSITSCWQMIEEYYEARVKHLEETKERSYYPLAPKKLYLNEEQLWSYISRYSEVIAQIVSGENANFTLTPSLYYDSQTKHQPVMELLKELLTQGSGKKIYLACFAEGTRERLAKTLKDNGIPYTFIYDWEDNQLPAYVVGLLVAPIEQGFQTKQVIVLSEQDILGERISRAISARKRKEVSITLSQITPGDLVVHSDYGIGRFMGLTTIKVAGHEHDFVEVQYYGEDKVYVPVENLELITAYGQEDVRLDRLGSASWQRRKAQIRNRIKMAATELMKIAAVRQMAEAPILVPSSEIYDKFVSRFPYLETDDQMQAINEVVDDLASGKPMDRLICGDVGFGKTEVALRAACIAVAAEEAVQVAVVVPTTLLSRQHYHTFCERFAQMPVVIKQLSKFTYPSEVPAIKKGLKEGRVDIVVGTHALLSESISFANLGLIIIDEEQHFGVQQKEKLKALRANTHVLTLSATPIPRTLQMSLAGIRSLSLITTPPIDRLPIRTSVLPYDELIIREALLREHFRGGRIFYITPRVAYLDGIAARLKILVPELKYQIAHGGMSAVELDTIMNDFYDGKFDVLISTSIVESGLDIPMANTIVVDSADMFGLAQLYQIRGRVGRRQTKAFAYLTTPKDRILTENARKRLEVLSKLDSLGVGFRIASHDMEIRGYGNLIGEEQSGQIQEVGMELYQQMLNQAIEELSHADYDIGPQGGEQWSPTINLGITIQIPTSYIDDGEVRLELYRRIAKLETQEDLEIYAAELIDRFGKMPDPMENLFDVVKLKLVAKQAYVSKIDVGTKGFLLTFYNNQPKFPEKVLEFVNKNPRLAKLKGNHQLIIMKTWASSRARIKGLEEIIRGLL